jgi:Zn-dependent membrane protease YugP
MHAICSWYPSVFPFCLLNAILRWIIISLFSHCVLFRRIGLLVDKEASALVLVLLLQLQLQHQHRLLLAHRL